MTRQTRIALSGIWEKFEKAGLVVDDKTWCDGRTRSIYLDGVRVGHICFTSLGGPCIFSESNGKMYTTVSGFVRYGIVRPPSSGNEGVGV